MYPPSITAPGNASGCLIKPSAPTMPIPINSGTAATPCPTPFTNCVRTNGVNGVYVRPTAPRRDPGPAIFSIPAIPSVNTDFHGSAAVFVIAAPPPCMNPVAAVPARASATFPPSVRLSAVSCSFCIAPIWLYFAFSAVYCSSLPRNSSPTINPCDSSPLYSFSYSAIFTPRR